MALRTGAGWGAATVSVTTTATALAFPALSKVALIKNPSSNTATIYFGGSDLTNANVATDGYPLAPGESLSLATESRGDALSQSLYAVVASGTANLSVLGGGA